MQTKRTTKRRTLTGVVASNKMTKTVSVVVARTVTHPKYGKRYVVSRKFLAHAEGEFKVGDSVVIEETRPLSARKRWRVISKA